MSNAQAKSDELPDSLILDEAGPGRFLIRHPAENVEGRDVVFGGQYLAQMLMAAERVNGGKDIKSIHAIFARVGTYTQPIELVVDEMQGGRTWASHTITAMQNGRLLSRGIVLSSIDDPDLMRHSPTMPVATAPGGKPVVTGHFMDVETTDAGPANEPDGVPRSQYWHRYKKGPLKSLAANQAILAWASNGQLIGLGVRAHADTVDLRQAHRTISTGVIAQTVHFHERFDISSWLLICEEATYAGRGRVYGQGSVFTEDGKLVATYSQDSMARKIEASLDPKNQM
jgi:acyl-CoA thioesterase-2